VIEMGLLERHDGDSWETGSNWNEDISDLIVMGSVESRDPESSGTVDVIEMGLLERHDGDSWKTGSEWEDLEMRSVEMLCRMTRELKGIPLPLSLLSRLALGSRDPETAIQSVEVLCRIWELMGLNWRDLEIGCCGG